MVRKRISACAILLLTRQQCGTLIGAALDAMEVHYGFGRHEKYLSEPVLKCVNDRRVDCANALTLNEACSANIHIANVSNIFHRYGNPLTSK